MPKEIYLRMQKDIDTSKHKSSKNKVDPEFEKFQKELEKK